MNETDLKKVRALGADFEICKERIARLRSAMESLSHQFKISPSRSTKERDILGKQVAKVADLEADLIIKSITYEQTLSEMDQCMRALPSMHRTILGLRYMQGMAWGDIAKQTNYSYSHCQRFHKEAIEIMRQNETSIRDIIYPEEGVLK